MKIRVERDGFADAVAWAARILPQKAALPVLAGLRLEVGPDGALELSGFDYEVSAQAQIDATVCRGRFDPGARPAARRDCPQPAAAADRPRHGRFPSGPELGFARFTLPTLAAR